MEPDARGWLVKCTVLPDRHFAGPCRSRDKAVKAWNEKQEAQDETA